MNGNPEVQVHNQGAQPLRGRGLLEARLLLPYVRAEMPGWGTVAKHLHELHFTGVVQIRDKRNGMLMRLDLSDWCQRLTYFLGRYYEQHVLWALGSLLRPGDRFVDVGANIGMITLHARSLVGATGSVDCVEPNPECVSILRRHLQLNGITNATVHDCGLSDAPSTLHLNLTSAHTGTATFGAVESPLAAIAVGVRTGDDVLSHSDKPVAAMKIDVEGFELQVLRGLVGTIQRDRPFIVMEVIEQYLRNAGTSCGELNGLMTSLGYTPYRLTERRQGTTRRLALQQSAPGAATEGDYLWSARTLPESLVVDHA